MDETLSNEPQSYAVTLNLLVKADSYSELRKRVAFLQDAAGKVFRSDPNLDGYYIGLDDAHSTIKPPVDEYSHDVKADLPLEGFSK